MVSYSSSTDLQLVNLLKQGDENAFAHIYDRYAEHLAGFAASKLYALDDAKDIIHDVFVKLWTERRTLTIDRDLKAYLFTLARFRIVDKIRKDITRKQYEALIQRLANTFEASAEQQVAVKELQQHLEDSLTQLSPRVVEIFRLSREQHLSISEIAKMLGLSEQTVKNQLSTALKHLRHKMYSLPVSGLAIYLLS